MTKVFNRYSLTMDHNRYLLLGSTIRSYLSWLHDESRPDITFDNNRMLWKAGVRSAR
ncbi:MAG: hypothetical protein HUJ86_00950 [Synergistes sp.]|nr:hypothetical protein [Synergistes sp.]